MDFRERCRNRVDSVIEVEVTGGEDVLRKWRDGIAGPGDAFDNVGNDTEGGDQRDPSYGSQSRGVAATAGFHEDTDRKGGCHDPEGVFLGTCGAHQESGHCEGYKLFPAGTPQEEGKAGEKGE